MTNLIEKCNFCNSDNLTSQTNLSGMHWGSLHCGNCGRHLTWLQNPDITAQFEQRQSLIQRAFESDRLTSWERFFLKNVQGSRHLSPKQEQKYQQIMERHGIKVNSVPCGQGTG